jgi:hypothetical protein
MRNRDFRGRFIKNTKPQKEDETSTQKAKETETEILGEETVEQNPNQEDLQHPIQSVTQSIYIVPTRMPALFHAPTRLQAVTAWLYSTFLATHSTKPATVSESTTTYHLARSTHSESESQTTPTTS